MIFILFIVINTTNNKNNDILLYKICFCQNFKKMAFWTIFRPKLGKFLSFFEILGYQ